VTVRLAIINIYIFSLEIPFSNSYSETLHLTILTPTYQHPSHPSQILNSKLSLLLNIDISFPLPEIILTIYPLTISINQSINPSIQYPTHPKPPKSKQTLNLTVRPSSVPPSKILLLAHLSPDHLHHLCRCRYSTQY
jgi:hypothetical protein